ncbi:ABC transporter permease [Paenibacillus campinasensis]|uniref:ABC transporter permease n=1 Tax=Paenibacillus campinasensis TaxID=66347 RepID=A0ABW9T8B6_9BACL|nr:ABC transporter permease [Paenibacillus campinasensis]
MLKIIRDVKKYKDYLYYNIRVNLRLKVSNTLLGYLWWLLDPLLQMLVYTMIVSVIFNRGEEKFPIFVFCALLSWKWFSSTVTYCANCIKANSGVLNQVYIPKFLFPLQETIVNLIKFIFGFIILIIMLIAYRVAPTFHFFEIILVIAANFLFIFSISTLLTHYGVFISDMRNFLSHVNRVWWYLSPGMYSLEIVPKKYTWLFWLNPNTAFFESYRNVILYGKSPHYVSLLIWISISIIFLYIGLRKLYAFDRSYSKIV